jgi:hypothetical protein
MKRFTDYNEASNYARQTATKFNLDVAIRAAREFGQKGFNVAFASRNDSDYYTAEIVHPGKCPSCGTNGTHYCPADIARD